MIPSNTDLIIAAMLVPTLLILCLCGCVFNEWLNEKLEDRNDR